VSYAAKERIADSEGRRLNRVDEGIGKTGMVTGEKEMAKN